jgi:hypothetical protein
MRYSDERDSFGFLGSEEELPSEKGQIAAGAEYAELCGCDTPFARLGVNGVWLVNGVLLLSAMSVLNFKLPSRWRTILAAGVIGIVSIYSPLEPI